MEVKGLNIEDAYSNCLSTILAEGRVEDSRIGDVREIIGLSVEIQNPCDRIISNPARKISWRFMLGEFLWIMSGREDLDMIVHYNKRMKEFSDDSVVLHGAYGKRLREWQGFDQISGIIMKLMEVPNTRQAVMVIFDPKRDMLATTKDVPCNNLLQFFIRENKLHLCTYVRSQDFFLGFPYDVFHWTLLQEIVAYTLGVEVGCFRHNIGSGHLYATNWEQANQIITSKEFNRLHMPKVDVDFFSMGKLFAVEETLRLGNTVPMEKLNLTPFERWVADNLQKKGA